MPRPISSASYGDAVATTRDQAMMVFKPAFANIKRWARQSAGVARSFKVYEGINQERIMVGVTCRATCRRTERGTSRRTTCT